MDANQRSVKSNPAALLPIEFFWYSIWAAAFCSSMV